TAPSRSSIASSTTSGASWRACEAPSVLVLRPQPLDAQADADAVRPRAELGVPARRHRLIGEGQAVVRIHLGGGDLDLAIAERPVGAASQEDRGAERPVAAGIHLDVEAGAD